MKKVCLLILLLCAVSLFAAEENEILIFPEPGCDVGDLKWGMTVEEVQARLGKKLVYRGSEDSVSIYTFESKLYGSNTEVSFIFLCEKLIYTTMHIRLYGEKCERRDTFFRVLIAQSREKIGKEIQMGHLFSVSIKIRELYSNLGIDSFIPDGFDLEERAARSELCMWKTQKGYMCIALDNSVLGSIEITFFSNKI